MSKAMNGATKTALLSNRNVLRIVGPDRFTFLQGLISQDIQLAVDGKPLYTAFLTPQGKYLFDFFVVPQDDYLLLDCDAAQANELIRRLLFYKMRSQINIEDPRSHFSVFACWGAPSNEAIAYADPRLPELGERIIIRKDNAARIPTNREEDDYKEHRYKHGVAEGSFEIENGIATLLELNFDTLNAISWSKGCYMGQELTARTRYRGLIKKRYLPFKFEGLPPERHHDILHEGYSVGRVMAIGKDYGLGLFQLEKIKPFIEEKRMVVHHGTTFDVRVPDYVKQKIFEPAA